MVPVLVVPVAAVRVMVMEPRIGVAQLMMRVLGALYRRARCAVMPTGRLLRIRCPIMGKPAHRTPYPCA